MKRPEKKRHIEVDFIKSGWRQFARMNRSLGARYVKGFILRHELAAYIAAHEESGKHLDTICQEIHYEDGIYLLLMKCQGIWYITDIWAMDAPEGFAPVFIWQRIKKACRNLLVKVLVGWRNIMAPKASAGWRDITSASVQGEPFATKKSGVSV